MFTAEERFYHSICELEYAENYDGNEEIFEKAIDVLKTRLQKKDFSEFDDDEREALEGAFSLIHEEQ